jgi:hypothetical protein
VCGGVIVSYIGTLAFALHTTPALTAFSPGN